MLTNIKNLTVYLYIYSFNCIKSPKRLYTLDWTNNEISTDKHPCHGRGITTQARLQPENLGLIGESVSPQPPRPEIRNTILNFDQ
jgi:hypothetical protein